MALRDLAATKWEKVNRTHLRQCLYSHGAVGDGKKKPSVDDV